VSIMDNLGLPYPKQIDRCVPLVTQLYKKRYSQLRKKRRF